MARPTPALTKFVLSLPLELPVKEVVALARAKGMKAKKKKVLRIRRDWLAHPVRPAVAKLAAPARPAASAKPAPQPAVPPKSVPLSRSDFIRLQPATMPVAEVVAKGKEAGMTFSGTLVYMVRRRAAAKETSGKAAAPARKSVPIAPKARLSPSTNREALLKAVASELGLGRAIAILKG
jgi:hypothetical protein